MHYVKQFKINGVDTKQVACIELHGRPNAATEGAVGVLGIDMDSPLHDVYKCVAVNGSIYTWDLLSSGLSIMSATTSGGGTESVQFPYVNLLTPNMYVIKIGDLILDSEGYLYQVNALNTTFCEARYCGTQVVAYGMSAYDEAIKHGFKGDEKEWLESLKAVAVIINASVSSDSAAWVEDTVNGGYYQTIAVDGILPTDNPIVDVVLGDDVDANEFYVLAWYCVTRITTGENSITLYANRYVPETAFTIQLKVVR
jgi:hypothetical protein